MMHCQISPAGKFAVNTYEEPVNCAAGYFSDVGATYCVQCPPGYKCEESTGRHNAMCQPGSYYTGDGTCKECPVGKFCPIAIPGYRETADIVACPDGTYAPKGSFECMICKPGHNCGEIADSGTTGGLCPDGTFSLGGAETCLNCPKNYECPSGETINRCPIFFYSLDGERECKPCPNG